jgi:hypothetical protein
MLYYMKYTNYLFHLNMSNMYFHKLNNFINFKDNIHFNMLDCMFLK